MENILVGVAAEIAVTGVYGDSHRPPRRAVGMQNITTGVITEMVTTRRGRGRGTGLFSRPQALRMARAGAIGERDHVAPRLVVSDGMFGTRGRIVLWLPLVNWKFPNCRPLGYNR